MVCCPSAWIKQLVVAKVITCPWQTLPLLSLAKCSYTASQVPKSVQPKSARITNTCFAFSNTPLSNDSLGKIWYKLASEDDLLASPICPCSKAIQISGQ